jgi:hypothetical protein
MEMYTKHCFKNQYLLTFQSTGHLSTKNLPWKGGSSRWLGQLDAMPAVPAPSFIRSGIFA